MAHVPHGRLAWAASRGHGVERVEKADDCPWKRPGNPICSPSPTPGQDRGLGTEVGHSAHTMADEGRSRSHMITHWPLRPSSWQVHSATSLPHSCLLCQPGGPPCAEPSPHSQGTFPSAILKSRGTALPSHGIPSPRACAPTFDTVTHICTTPASSPASQPHLTCTHTCATSSHLHLYIFTTPTPTSVPVPTLVH